MMNHKIKVSRVDALPPDFREELGAAASREDFRAIEWLQNDWVTGVNRFNAPGEACYIAEFSNRLVGLCGLNRDPFVDDAPIGRLRRMYVLPEFRRLGIGHQLVLRAVQDGREHFRVVRQRTFDEDSAAFFESIGFTIIEGNEEASHEMRID